VSLSTLGGVGTYVLTSTVCGDKNYDAASAPGQVSVYKISTPRLVAAECRPTGDR
jgi:hypothetical protein